MSACQINMEHKAADVTTLKVKQLKALIQAAGLSHAEALDLDRGGHLEGGPPDGRAKIGDDARPHARDRRRGPVGRRQ